MLEHHRDADFSTNDMFSFSSTPATHTTNPNTPTTEDLPRERLPPMTLQSLDIVEAEAVQLWERSNFAFQSIYFLCLLA